MSELLLKKKQIEGSRKWDSVIPPWSIFAGPLWKWHTSSFLLMWLCDWHAGLGQVGGVLGLPAHTEQKPGHEWPGLCEARLLKHLKEQIKKYRENLQAPGNWFWKRAVSALKMRFQYFGWLDIISQPTSWIAPAPPYPPWLDLIVSRRENPEILAWQGSPPLKKSLSNWTSGSFWGSIRGPLVCNWHQPPPKYYWAAPSKWGE